MSQVITTSCNVTLTSYINYSQQKFVKQTFFLEYLKLLTKNSFFNEKQNIWLFLI